MEKNESPGLLSTRRDLSEVLSVISESLLILLEKRETMEERMIKNCLSEIALGSCKLLKILLEENTAPSEKERLQTEIDLITLELLPELRQFLKILRYDWNYLEQYFEYDFYKRLTNDYSFADRLRSLA